MPSLAIAALLYTDAAGQRRAARSDWGGEDGSGSA